MSTEAFFEPDGDRLRATELTRGPWSGETQHAGPPCALLARAAERVGSGGDRRVARITFEILRPVAIGTFTTQAEVVRPGRRVDLVECRLLDAEGPVIVARAWRLRSGDLALGDDAGASGAPADGAPAGPEQASAEPFFDTGHDVGYHTAMEVRFLEGAFRTAGAARVWFRMRVPLVAGEEPSPLARVLVAADSGNGVSAVLDPAEHLFVNTDLNVHLTRHPTGEWVRLDARTEIAPDGIGLASSRLWDEDGPIGIGAQTLLVAPRS